MCHSKCVGPVMIRWISVAFLHHQNKPMKKLMTNACTCTFTENYQTIVKLIGIKEKNMNIKTISQYL